MSEHYVTGTEIRHGMIDKNGEHIELVFPEGAQITKADIGDDDAWNQLVAAGAVVEADKQSRYEQDYQPDQD